MVNTRAFSRHLMYRTHLDDYAEKWSEYFHFKRENGVLEVAMHTDGKEAKWDLELHRAFIPAFADIHHDPENECIILTGTGDSFLSTFDESSWDRNGFREPFEHRHGYDVFYFDQTKEPFSLLNLEIPVIAAVNGPLIIHAELALLNDIVIASETTFFQDTHYTGMGIVPGDGVHTLFRELLGHNRGKYFLLTGEKLDAKQSKDLGLISEVLPPEKLLDRAWEIAETIFMARNRIHRRVTRSLLVQPWRELFTKELSFGHGLESWACHDYWPMAKEADFDGSSILTGQPEVWTRAARLNEGGPRLLDPRCVLEQREESRGPWLTVAMMRHVCVRHEALLGWTGVGDLRCRAVVAAG